jgi:subtilisin family serine protease
MTIGESRFELYQEPEFPEEELLVAEQHVELVRAELTDLGVTAGEPSTAIAGVVRLPLQLGPYADRQKLGERIDEVRRNSARKFNGFQPLLSPVHQVTVGQPNIRGNPADARPHTVGQGLPARKSSEGAGVTVAIIDNGIVLHDWLNGGYIAMPSDFDELDEKKIDVLGEQAGHGVFLAGLVLQHAPGATVRVYRTSDRDGRAPIDEVAEAIERAGAGRADIINLSLGCFTRNNQPPWTFVRALAGLPTTTAVVASAGNSSTSRLFWPGALPRVTGVGALTRQDGEWILGKYTNFGPWVDAYIPATQVRSTFITYTGKALFREEDNTLSTAEVEYDTGWAEWSGTSMAAAIWSGAVARAMTEQSLSPIDASRTLRDEPSSLSFASEIVLKDDQRFEEVTQYPRRARCIRPISDEPKSAS